MVDLAKLVTRSDSNRQELLHEQRRLSKLWDAFKRQEDEYRAIERERDDLWARVQELEKATARLGDPTKTLTRLEHLEQENERLRASVADLGDRLDQYRQSFHGEQERLAKLYKVYEDTEADLGRSRRELEKWHTFWSRYGDDLPPKVAQGAARTTGVKLTAKQLAQRKYAAEMKAVRARARTSPGGKGPIRKRAAARRLRQKLGLKG